MTITLEQVLAVVTAQRNNALDELAKVQAALAAAVAEIDELRGASASASSQ
jgi:phage gp36-like protein